MGKLIFFTIIAVLIYWLIKSRQIDESTDDATPKAIEDMVRCSYCGVHLPKSESISEESKFFCSDEHRQAFLDSSD